MTTTERLRGVPPERELFLEADSNITGVVGVKGRVTWYLRRGARREAIVPNWEEVAALPAWLQRWLFGMVVVFARVDESEGRRIAPLLRVDESGGRRIAPLLRLPFDMGLEGGDYSAVVPSATTPWRRRARTALGSGVVPVVMERSF